MEQYSCYGQQGKTTYSALPDGLDGVLVKSEGSESIKSTIRIICSNDYTLLTNYTFSYNENFSVDLLTPYGCRGSGFPEGDVCKDEKCCNSLTKNLCAVSGTCFMKSGLCVYDNCYDYYADGNMGCPLGCYTTGMHKYGVFSNGTVSFYDENHCFDETGNSTPNVCIMLSGSGEMCDSVFLECRTYAVVTEGEERDFCVVG